MVQLSHLNMTAGKTIALTIQTFVSKVKSFLFKTLFWFVIAFLPRSKRLLISWLQSVCSDFGAQENKICHCFHFFLSICHEVMGLDAMHLVFWMLSFKPVFSLSSSTLLKRLFVPLHFLPLEWHRLHIGCDMSPSSLDSSLWFLQPGTSHDVLCM